MPHLVSSKFNNFLIVASRQKLHDAVKTFPVCSKSNSPSKRLIIYGFSMSWSLLHANVPLLMNYESIILTLRNPFYKLIMGVPQTTPPSQFATRQLNHVANVHLPRDNSVLFQRRQLLYITVLDPGTVFVASCRIA